MITMFFIRFKPNYAGIAPLTLRVLIMFLLYQFHEIVLQLPTLCAYL